MSPRAGFFRGIATEANARRVDPATWDPGLPVFIPQLQASLSSEAPTSTPPPQDGSLFSPSAPSTPIPQSPLPDPAARMVLAVRSTPTSTSPVLVRRASASDPSPGAIVAIVVGVTLFFVLVAVLLHLREVKACCKYLVMRIRRRGLATPAKEERQWDVLSWNEASALASTAASTPEPYTAHTARMRDVSIHLVSTAEHAPLPPLQPNRRPPSGMLDPPSARPSEPAPPLPRLEPLRRKPSKSSRLAREPTPPATPPKDVPSLPSPSPSSVSATASASVSTFTSERRAEPSGGAPAKLTIQIQMPKPVRGDVRPISAYTSASTTLSEMPLLKPSTRAHHAHGDGKDARLSKVLTVANPNEAPSPGGATYLPPIPPVPPIPPIYLPRAAAAEREREPARPLPAKPFDSLGGPQPSGSKPIPTRTTSQDTVQSPASLASGSGSGSDPSSPALRRQNSSSSTRSPRSPLRKPVPPLMIPFSARSRSPSDGEIEGDAVSSIWAPENGWRKNSLASTALDELAGSRWGSPVPSSSASQMYRTRDSGLSEWTWSRPLEDWEREQMNMSLKRKASAGDLSPPAHGPQRGMSLGGGLGMGGGGLGAGAAAGEGKWGHKASASMGEMRVVRGVVPGVPKVPRQYRP